MADQSRTTNDDLAPAEAREWNAVSYDRISDPQYAWGQKVIDRMAALPLRGDEQIIDAGCGTGRITADILERLPRVTVIAIDCSENMLERAAERLRRFGDRVSFKLADLQTFCEDEIADVVFSTATLHWIKDHPRLFANLRRILRPGGFLVAQCGGGGNLHRFHERAHTLIERAPYAPYFTDRSDPWEFADDRTTTARLRAAGFEAIHADLEPLPTTLADAATYGEFVRNVILRLYLARLPSDELRDELITELAEQATHDEPPFSLDYVRLNIRARRPT
jgi:trans-aconitate methyltransferase